MNRCPITYKPVDEDKLYSDEGLRLLAPSLKQLSLLNYSADELRQEAWQRAGKISLQGVQPKLSAILNAKKSQFDLVDIGGKFILKPQHHIFPELPQNEDLTMRLADLIGIDTPLHGLIFAKDNSLTYFIRRFDRKGQKDRIPVEDFAQLAGMNRDTKYNYSMEKLVNLIDQYCTFPVIEKSKLFKLTLFNFLVGNEDMHLKNFSVITQNGLIQLSPTYDLLNSTIVLSGDAEEIALSLYGKKRKLNSQILINYFGKERCSLTEIVIEKIINQIKSQYSNWQDLIEISFLSSDMKLKYKTLLTSRYNTLFKQ